MAFASLFIRTTSRGVAMTVTVFTKPHCPQCDATKRSSPSWVCRLKPWT